MVYFIQSGNDGPIKIGQTTNLLNRLRGLQTSIPHKVNLIGATENVSESSLHRRFQSHRLHGEWFAPVPEILELAASYALPEDPRAFIRGRSKMRPEEVSADAIAIVAARDGGETLASIAARYGVTRQAVHQRIAFTRRVLEAVADDSKKPAGVE